MLDIEELAEEVKYDTEWQSTPYPVADEDFVKTIIWAIKKFYVDVNHPGEYDRTLFTTDENDKLVYDYDFDLVQEAYILILAKINFLSKVLSDVSGDGAISYTTNALSVTGAKEGYKSIQEQINSLEQERIRVFHKMMARDQNET